MAHATWMARVLVTRTVITSTSCGRGFIQRSWCSTPSARQRTRRSVLREVTDEPVLRPACDTLSHSGDFDFCYMYFGVYWRVLVCEGGCLRRKAWLEIIGIFLELRGFFLCIIWRDLHAKIGIFFLSNLWWTAIFFLQKAWLLTQQLYAFRMVLNTKKLFLHFLIFKYFAA